MRAHRAPLPAQPPRPTRLSATGPRPWWALPLLAACTDGLATEAASGVVALALLVAAVGFYGLGVWRERARSGRALRDAHALARLWSSLLPHATWRTDAEHRLVDWCAGPAAGHSSAPAAEALRSALAAQRPLRALRLPAEGQAQARWLLDGEPDFDGDGRFCGFVGSARPCADDDGAALAAAALGPLLAACSGAALLAQRQGDVGRVLQFNPPAGALWRDLAPGSSLAAALSALPAAVGEALSALPAGQTIEVEGWRLVRLGPLAAGDGLLLARTGSTAPEADAFGPTLSHDLRAPIRVVEGFTRIVKEDYGRLLDRVGNDHLDRVLGAATRMNLMIDALLTLARLSSQPLARQPVNLSQLAAYVIEDLKRAAPERQVEVAIEAGLSVQGDPTLLRMVLENLLGNAWKYTARAPRARIALRRSESGGRVGFEVVDNGAGFDMRSAERLFGLFQRLHSQSDFPGHGVGLASVRRIVQRHGGEVWAEAEPGRGATFSFTLG